MARAASRASAVQRARRSGASRPIIRTTTPATRMVSPSITSARWAAAGAASNARASAATAAQAALRRLPGLMIRLRCGMASCRCSAAASWRIDADQAKAGDGDTRPQGQEKSGSIGSGQIVRWPRARQPRSGGGPLHTAAKCPVHAGLSAGYGAPRPVDARRRRGGEAQPVELVRENGSGERT